MQRQYIGIEVFIDRIQTYAVAAASAKCDLPKRVNLNLLSKVTPLLTGSARAFRRADEDPTLAVNAAVQRLLEKLYLRRLIQKDDIINPDVVVFLKPRHREKDVLFNVEIKRKHWLITVASTLWKAGKDV